MDQKQKRRTAVIQKELLLVQKQEQKLERSALRAKPAGWKTTLESKIPAKVYAGLESAFSKGFSLVFQQGRGIIEKGIRKEDLQADHAIRDYAVHLKGSRKELKQMRKAAGQSDLKNMAITTAEGIGLGALGIGMPDVVLFLTNLLKGIYETALNYGFGYESRTEQYIILCMMETALRTGEDWVAGNGRVEELLIRDIAEPSQTDFDTQIKATASAFAMDMLILKFIQGIPVVGILGGAANPVYYHKVMHYVKLKYRKRYLMGLINEQGAEKAQSR